MSFKLISAALRAVSSSATLALPPLLEQLLQGEDLSGAQATAQNNRAKAG